jgi:hypothetical protein
MRTLGDLTRTPPIQFRPVDGRAYRARVRRMRLRLQLALLDDFTQDRTGAEPLR